MITVQSLLASVRIYADYDAFTKDEFGRRTGNGALMRMHDELYQSAIDAKLASLLGVVEPRRRVPAFHDRCQLLCRKPQWWPAYCGPLNKRDLFMLKLRPLADAPLGNTWLKLREILEDGPKSTPIWQDDPFLAFEPIPNRYFCRTACLGHEGWVLYFAYDRESEWEELLVSRGLRPSGRGESAYTQLVKVPGFLGGRL